MWGDWHFKQTPPLLGEMEKAGWAGNWLGKMTLGRMTVFPGMMVVLVKTACIKSRRAWDARQGFSRQQDIRALEAWVLHK